MTRFEYWLLHIANILVGGTGLVYAFMRYVLSPTDPYAVINHPWQPTVQHLHVLAAPVLVFAVGLIWSGHIGLHLSLGARKQRTSGYTLVAMFAPMAASGYLLQTTTEEVWRMVWLATHLGASGLWLVGFGAHQGALLWKKSKISSFRSKGLPRAVAYPEI